MAIDFYDSVDPKKGFFNIAGKLFKAQTDMNTSRATTIPDELTALITQYNLQTLTAPLTAAIQPVANAAAGYQSGMAGTFSTLQAFLQAFLILIVNTDSPQPDNSLTTALVEFIRQMVAQAKTLNASAVTIAATAGGTNNGDGVCLVTKKGGKGLDQENAIAETLVGTAQATSLTAGFQFLGQAAASNPLGQDWPAGSGATKTLTSVDANSGSGSLLSNGGFETFVNQANVPDNWICSVGTPGTHLIATTIEVQTLTVTGTPTAGTYTISWQNPAGKTQTTAPLAYNAAASAVQTALRALAGLSQVTVSATGSTPNYTHTITFVGMGGNLNQITVTDNTTGGTHTFTPGTTTGGTPQVFAGGRALEFVGDGSTLTAINQAIVGLTPNTAYAVSLWAICDAAIAAGVIKIELIDGIGGSVIADAQSANNVITFNASALTTSWQHLSVLQAAECIFRTPAQVPPLVYIRIRLSTALTNAKNMFVDQVAFAPVTEFYSGAPGAVMFTGSKPWDAADSFTVAVTNDRAGLVREWMNRNLDLAAKELLLPTSGSPNIPDGVIA